MTSRGDDEMTIADARMEIKVLQRRVELSDVLRNATDVHSTLMAENARLSRQTEALHAELEIKGREAAALADKLASVVGTPPEGERRPNMFTGTISTLSAISAEYVSLKEAHTKLEEEHARLKAELEVAHAGAGAVTAAANADASATSAVAALEAEKIHLTRLVAEMRRKARSMEEELQVLRFASHDDDARSSQRGARQLATLKAQLALAQEEKDNMFTKTMDLEYRLEVQADQLRAARAELTAATENGPSVSRDEIARLRSVEAECTRLQSELASAKAAFERESRRAAAAEASAATAQASLAAVHARLAASPPAAAHVPAVQASAPAPTPAAPTATAPPLNRTSSLERIERAAGGGVVEGDADGDADGVLLVSEDGASAAQLVDLVRTLKVELVKKKKKLLQVIELHNTYKAELIKKRDQNKQLKELYTTNRDKLKKIAEKHVQLREAYDKLLAAGVAATGEVAAAGKPPEDPSLAAKLKKKCLQLKAQLEEAQAEIGRLQKRATEASMPEVTERVTPAEDEAARALAINLKKQQAARKKAERELGSLQAKLDATTARVQSVASPAAAALRSTEKRRASLAPV